MKTSELLNALTKTKIAEELGISKENLSVLIKTESFDEEKRSKIKKYILNILSNYE